MWINGVYQGSEYESSTTKGFTFGQGQHSQSCQNKYEMAGAGGGFFGGYTKSSNQGGGGGGSSFAFTSGIDYPKELIEAKNENGTLIEKSYYLFRDQPEYYLTSVTFSTGIWSGNGHARITLLIPLTQYQCTNYRFPFISSLLTFTFISFIQK